MIMKQIFSGLTLAALCLCSFFTLADSEANLSRLAQSPSWHHLLAYEPSADGWQSQVISDGFFFSPSGKNDPLAELQATVLAMQSAAAINPDEHPQCRFRGRYLWLKSKTDTTAYPQIVCDAYERWTGGDVQSVSLILATGYLGNPASFYGHTLIKINRASTTSRNRLLDESINYGAIIPDRENPLLYIIRGISGLYEAGFTNEKYYFHDHNYGEAQLRDQWEYELNLSPGDAELVVAHAWEMLGWKYDYYFFTRNCAYQMAELFEVAEGVSFKPDNLFMVPQTVFQSLADAEYRGGPLLKQVYYFPSRQRQLYNRYQSLTASEQQAVREIVDTGEIGSNLTYQQHSETARQRIIDTALDYYRFAQVAVEGQSAQRTPENPVYMAALKERFRLPAGGENEATVQPAAPHHGRAPGLIRVSGYSVSDGQRGASMTLRPAYYDPLDASEGHVKNGRLEMGTLSVAFSNEGLHLRSFDLVSIESFNAGITGLPGDKGFSWKLRGGMIRQSEGCDNCLVPRFSSSAGLAKSVVRDQLLLAGFVGGGVQDSRNESGYAYTSATLQAIFHADRLGLEVRSEWRHHLAGDWSNEYEHSLQGRYQTSVASEIRLEVLHNRETSVQLGYGVYW